MEGQTNKFQDYLKGVESDLINYKLFADAIGCDALLLNCFDKAIDICLELNKLIKKTNIKINYLNQFKINFTNIFSNFQYRGEKDISFIPDQGEQWISITKENIENNFETISNNITQIVFKLDFFQKIEFFSSNIVAIGANGSGKTSLSNKLRDFLQNNGVALSAQRVLLVPTFDSINNPTTTANQLRQYQKMDKTYKTPTNYRELTREFEFVLRNLISENISTGNYFRRNFIECQRNNKKIPEPPITNLDRTLTIWNNLIEHRKIDCSDGMNITVHSDTISPYPAIQMSDGEKVMLYLISQVLQAPEDGFIIVDEPEMYLHKTILKKLWDNLEKQRQDCLFIYLTHDLDFATSRTTAKKIWIKSFIHPDYWEIETIPHNEIPETLLFELLGSRKDILFCEGERGSIDEKIYSILFPQYTITPVGNCFQVINHTKAFNRLTNLHTIAVGLIDSDHHGDSRLTAIRKERIYSFDVVETENLLLDEDFLLKLALRLMKGDIEVNKIKDDVITKLIKEKELQVSNYISAKIDYYFKDSNIKKGNDLLSVKENYEEFTKEIEIDEWYQARISDLESIISNKDYKKALAVFNNKGLKAIVNKHFKIKDFTERAIEYLQYNTESHGDLKKYFPEELLNSEIR